MSDLHGFDGIFQVSEDFLVRLTTAIESKFAAAIEDEDAACPDVDIVDRFLEGIANLYLLVPRQLFATRNPSYTLDPNTSLSELERRLLGHRNLGQWDEALQPNRLVFLRDQFYTLENPPVVSFETDQVRIPISGQAYLGRRFRTRAGEGPFEEVRSGDFSMDLIYTVQVIDEPDKGLSFQRFYSIVDGLQSLAPGDPTVPTLPQCQMQVYALNADTHRNPTWYLPPIDTQPEDLRRASFLGQPGDEVWERLDHPRGLRFQVQEREETLPSGRNTLRLYLVDLEGDVSANGGTPCEAGLDADVAAKPRQGRISLVFDHLENLAIDIPGESFTGSEAIIEESLVRINPWATFLFDALGQIPTEMFAHLEVLGDHGLDSPFFPKVFPLSFDAEIVPGQTWVTSSSQAITFSNTKVIAGDALVLAGTLTGSGGTIADVGSLLNITAGGRADMAAALSRHFFYDVFLDKLEEAINEKLAENEQVTAILSISAAFEDDGIWVTVGGQGMMPDAVLWFDISFSFSLKLPIRLRLQNAIARGTFEVEVENEDGSTTTERVRLPVDAWGEQIPTWVFLPEMVGGLGIQPQTFETADPDVNPVCFLGYCDPAELPTPTLTCTVEANAPVRYNDDGTERPPGPEDERDPTCHRQSDFSDNPELKHAQELGFVWPSEEEIQFTAQADLSFLGPLLALLIAVILPLFSFGLSNVVAGFADPIVTTALITTGVAFGVTMVAGITIVLVNQSHLDVLIGDMVSEKIADALASVSLSFNPTLDLHIGLVSYVVDLETQGDADVQQGALITRNRVIVETQDERTGLEGLLDEC